MKRKLINVLILVCVFMLCSSHIFAATTSNKIESSKTTFEVVDKSKSELDFGGTGHFVKELSSYDEEKGELNITLTVTNTAKKEELENPIELFLVLDNSKSMNNTYESKKKKAYVTETANKFVDSLFDYFKNIKIGIVGFSSVDPVANPNSTLGSSADAKLLLELSNSKESIKSAISSYSSSETGPFTNIDAGLSLAQSNFSNNAQTSKYLILISDGVPNLSLSTESTLSYSGTNATNTKQRLQNIEAQNINIYSVLAGYYEKDVENPQAPTIQETGKHMTYSQLVEEIFGTVTNPTAGKFYFINYENLYKSVNEDIYGEITYAKDNTLKNIVIKDYFTKQIMDNFNFSYATRPTIGEVTDIDTTNNSITWTIPELKEGETTSLVYTLKLKDNVDTSILNKDLPIEEKVDIEYVNSEGEKDDVSTDVTPKVRVSYEEVPTKAPTPDDTVTPDDELPQTGLYSTILCIVIALIAVFAITRLIYLQVNKDN